MKNQRKLTLKLIGMLCASGVGFQTFAPTAASVSVSGRITTATKRGIAGARVSMTDAGGSVQTVTTNPSGYYRFGSVAAGETYIFAVSHKRYTFPNSPTVQFVGDDLSEFNFAALP